ncbi:MAG: pyrimidine-nucleoside phosphorylase [Calditrichia bacterium]
MFNPVDIIRKKRDGQTLNKEELEQFILKYVHNELQDYQMAAFLMATYFQGMTFDETLALTNIMLNSGDVMDFSNIPGYKVDKHSTGGVGDKTSLILAPVVAANDIKVPMISGRGLGHTGGTLDKLESIPGFNVNLSLERFREMIRTIGVSLIGQTGEIAPADKKIYALRDVTATVECIPLITASIMSKKLAEGIDGLVLDIKSGSGAFMKSKEQAIELGEALVKVGNLAGKQVIGFLTNMDRPLGNYIGNWLEVKESIDCLKDNGPKELMELSLVLSAGMILLSGKCNDFKDAYKLAEETIKSGKAYDKFLEIVQEQGGDTSVIENPESYPTARHIIEVKAQQEGYIQHIDAYPLGVLSVELGAGRFRKEDPVDPQAGIILHKELNESVQPGDVLCTLHTNKDVMEEFSQKALASFKIGNNPIEKTPLIYHVITENGVEDWDTFKKN